MKYLITVSAVFAFATGAHSALAQTAPSATEASAYDGLHEAAHIGDTDAIQTLLKSGADIELRDGAGRTPLIVAAFASNDETIEILANAGADLNALESRAYDIVTISAVADDVELLDLALALGASPNNITSPYVGNALIAAAHLGHHEAVKSLIKNDAKLDHVNNLGWTALMEAVVLGNGGPAHIETVKLLLEAGADKSIADKQGLTPLQHAQSSGYSEIVRLIEESN